MTIFRIILELIGSNDSLTDKSSWNAENMRRFCTSKIAASPNTDFVLSEPQICKRWGEVSQQLFSKPDHRVWLFFEEKIECRTSKIDNAALNLSI